MNVVDNDDVDFLVCLIRMFSDHLYLRSAGFASFADRATLHSLAETSERVGLFLDRLVELLAPLARQTAQEHLTAFTEFPGDISARQGDSHPAQLLPCDLPYLLGLRRSSVHHEVGSIIITAGLFSSLYHRNKHRVYKHRHPR